MGPGLNRTHYGVNREKAIQEKSIAADGGQVYLDAADPGAANQDSCMERRGRARWQSLLS